MLVSWKSARGKVYMVVYGCNHGISSPQPFIRILLTTIGRFKFFSETKLSWRPAVGQANDCMIEGFC